MDNGFSLADAKAIAGDDDFGGGGGFWIILLFLVLFGGGNFGGFGSPHSLSTDFAVLDRKLDGIEHGICDSQYENVKLNNDTNMLIMNGINTTQAQMAQCCCDTQKAIHEEGDKTRAMIRENEIQTLRDKLNDVQREAALCGVMRYPTNASYCYQPPQMCNPCCY